MSTSPEKEKLINSFKHLKEQYKHFKTLLDWKLDLQEDSITGEIIYKGLHSRIVERAQFLEIAEDEFKKELENYTAELKKLK